MTTDWKSLAKETVHSFDADEVRGMWDVDWQRATSVFLADHEAEIAAEPRRWKKVLRKTNAIVFGLAKRLAPPRRLVFAFVLLLTLLAFLLAMELVDKLHFAVSSLVRELDRFLGRAACDDDVSIAAIRHKTA